MRFVLAAVVAVLAHAALLFALSPAEAKVVAPIEAVPFEVAITEVPPRPRGERGGEQPARSPPRARVPGAAAKPESVAAVAALELEVGAAEPAVREAEVEVAPAPRPAPASQDSETPEVNVNALVHARLSSAAERCYPAAARRFRQRGTVTVTFCGDLDARIVNGAVAQSSGASLLDAAAQNCVLAQSSPLPVEAASRCFSVPVRFGAP